MRRVPSPKQRLWVISALLIALVVRALIPAGFMPATDRPFSFQICPDGFPAALLGEAAPADGGAGTPASHDHDDGAPGHAAAGAALAHAGHGDDTARVHAGGGDDAAPAHTGHHHTGALDAGAPGQGSHHPADGLLAAAHHHDGPAHNHGTASAEHCVFAAAAGAFALAFSPAFSAPAASIGAPDVDYISPTFRSHRFRLPQPRGPPALS
jgi:hypothetical protein